MACKEAYVSHFGVLANHISEESEGYHGTHQYNRYLDQDSNRAYHEYKSETCPFHATSSLTFIDGSGSNYPALETDVALGQATRSA